MSIPLVSIVVPNYNHGRFLRDRLATVLEQTFVDFEVIILDDCSTDNSLPLLESYLGHPKVSLIVESDQNSGSPFYQWRSGLRHARGRYLWIAESDDLAYPFFLEHTVAAMDCRSRVAFSFVNSELIDGSGRCIGSSSLSLKGDLSNQGEKSQGHFRTTEIPGGDFVVDYLFPQSFPPNVSSVLFDKLFLEDAIKYALDFRFTGDRMVYACAASGGYSVVALELVANKARVSHGLKHSATYFNYFEEMFYSIHTITTDNYFTLSHEQYRRLTNIRVDLSGRYFITRFIRILKFYLINMPLANVLLMQSLRAALDRKFTWFSKVMVGILSTRKRP